MLRLLGRLLLIVELVLTLMSRERLGRMPTTWLGGLLSVCTAALLDRKVSHLRRQVCRASCGCGSVEIGNRPGDGVCVLVYVQALVDVGRDRLNLRAQITLDVVQIIPIIPVYQVDGKTKVTEAPRPADTMEIGLGVLGKVEVDDDVDGLDIDTTSEKV